MGIAAGGFHIAQQIIGNRIHPRKGCPGQFQIPLDDFIAYPQAMVFIGGKQVIGNVDLIEIQGVQILHFIYNFFRAAVSNPGSHHFAADAKNAFERTPPAGGHADRHVKRSVTAQRHQRAVRQGQFIEVFNRFSPGSEINIGSPTIGDPADIFQVKTAVNCPAKLYNGPFTFTDDNDIQIGIVCKGLLGAKRHMRPPYNGHDGRIYILDIFGDTHGHVEGHRNRGQADHLGSEVFQQVLQHGTAVRKHNQIKEFNLNAGRRQCAGQIRQPQRRGRGLGDRVIGVYE